MRTKLKVHLLLLTLLSLSGFAHGQATVISYQGRLTDGTGPLNGAYDFIFTLHPAANGGVSIAGVTNLNVEVSNGLFTARIDFGTVFDGTARWLEIAVRPGASTDGFTVLNPRQALTATPYALWTVALEPVTDDGTNKSIIVNPHIGNRFYRLAKSLNPGAILLAEDFNAGNGGFTVETPIAYNGPWVHNAASGSWQQAGQDADNGHPNTSLLSSPHINVTQVGAVRLTLAHRHSFEADFWDGGQVRVSINGGAFTAVPGSAFTQNGYNGTVRVNSVSELHGQSAFVENSATFAAGPITSICNLGSFQPGDTIRLQFVAASDSNTRGSFQPNWEIDSLQVAL